MHYHKIINILIFTFHLCTVVWLWWLPPPLMFTLLHCAQLGAVTLNVRFIIRSLEHLIV